VAGLVVVVLALGACAGGREPAGPGVTVPPSGDAAAHGLHVGAADRVPVDLADAAAAQSVVAATWRAGFAALQASDDEPAGAVVSPAGLVVALAMLAEGATGDGGAALDEALGASGQGRTDAVNALTAALARYEGDPAAVGAKQLPATPVVHVANQVVADDDITLAPAYLDRLAAGYGAGVLVTDLSSDAGKKELDAWVDENSGGLIKRSAIQPDPDLYLVLQNAVAFAARWAKPFDGAGTSDAPFTLASGEQVTLPTMHGTGHWAYAEQDGWRALRLPYAADLHADVLLPPAGSSAAADPRAADPGVVAALVARLDAATPVAVQVGLPRLDLTSTVTLVPALEAMGLGVLFDPATAGLAGIFVDPPDPPYLSQAVQQAVLKVDEDGTRAAAVTELGVAGAAAAVEPPLQMLVDRPYLFVVGDGQTGWPLFLASVLDPRG
jgi:serine protease inhibitor